MADRTRRPVKGYPGIYKVQRVKGVVYEARYRAEGKVRGRTFATLTEADAFLKTTRHAVHTGDYIPPEAGRVTFGDVAAAWLGGKQRANLKARTLDGYQHVINSWLARWATRPVGSITHLEVQQLLTDLSERKPQTVRNVFNVLRGVMDEAVDAGYVRANPCQRFAKKMPAANRTHRARFLMPQEVARLAGEMPGPYGLLVTFAAWSGLRAGEVAGLRAGRVDVARNRVQVRETVINLGSERRVDTPKSEKSRRTVPIPPPLARLLADHIAAHGLADSEYVWSGEGGQPLNHAAFYRRVFLPAAKRAGLGHVRFHDLRHTYASLMAHQGEDLYRVSRWMGHSTIAITADLYTHLFEGEDAALQSRLTAAFATGHTPDASVVSLAARRISV
jgi:integrase